MFQYAFAKNIALKQQTKLILDTSFINTKLPYGNYTTPMQYELGIFNIKDEIQTTTITNSKLTYPLAKLEYFIKKQFNQNKHYLLKETQHQFNSSYLQCPNNAFIIGNFQSEKYFIEHQSEILKHFQFIQPLDEINQSIANQINTTNSVSIHIRRGDYIKLPQNAKKFQQTPLSYYHDAINFLAQKISNIHCFIFSDDIDWAKENLIINHNKSFINHNKGKDSYKDMQLMSRCKHNIICNSTFSWWAAYLNSSKEKIVLAPNKWFANNILEDKDIIPQSWIKL